VRLSEGSALVPFLREDARPPEGREQVQLLSESRQR
jgi:hypothetical protein